LAFCIPQTLGAYKEKEGLMPLVTPKLSNVLIRHKICSGVSMQRGTPLGLGLDY
jgi:hypothetical protein